MSEAIRPSPEELAEVMRESYPNLNALNGGGASALSRTCQLAEVLTAVKRYLDLEDGEETFIVCALATAVSKALVDEEPLWLFLIGPRAPARQRRSGCSTRLPISASTS